MSVDFASTLQQKIKEKEAKVAILGLGYVGLPLAVVFAEAGYSVTGIDPDRRKVEMVCAGKSHIQDVSDDQVASLVRAGRLTATTDFAVLRGADAVSICVPTPLRTDRRPGSFLYPDATEELAKYMHPGIVVVLESTTYPGTTREILLPKLEEGKRLKSG